MLPVKLVCHFIASTVLLRVLTTEDGNDQLRRVHSCAHMHAQGGPEHIHEALAVVVFSLCMY